MSNIEIDNFFVDLERHRKEYLTETIIKMNKYHDTLVFILRTLDKEYNNEVQSTDNPIGVIRDKIDRVLNK